MHHDTFAKVEGPGQTIPRYLPTLRQVRLKLTNITSLVTDKTSEHQMYYASVLGGMGEVGMEIRNIGRIKCYPKDIVFGC
jgi:hypothetical protein